LKETHQEHERKRENERRATKEENEEGLKEGKAKGNDRDFFHFHFSQNHPDILCFTLLT
jgi:hypothetical protein